MAPLRARRAPRVSSPVAVPVPGPVAVAVAVVLLALRAAPVAAYDFALSVRTVGQGYQERRYGASGASELLSRRRLTQYLSLSVFNIEPEDPGAAATAIEIRSRSSWVFGSKATSATSCWTARPAATRSAS
jgi:hypothetical protein